MTNQDAFERGSTFYKKGKLLEAEAAYTEAARLAKHDPRPLSNLSAVKFEMGNYVGALPFALKALKLLENDENADTTSLEQELRVRLANSYLHSGKSMEARAMATKIAPATAERQLLETSLATLEASESQYANIKTLWDDVVNRLPRYRPALQDEPDYFHVGHDFAQTEFDQPLAQSSQQDYAFLFCGIGDARNLYTTMLFIREVGAKLPHLLKKKYYFTLVDIKPAALARDLLIFRMLFDYVTESDDRKKTTSMVIGYTFGAQLMPGWAYNRVQDAIKDLLADLQDSHTDVMGRFYIKQTDRDLIRRHLKNWQTPPKDWYSTEAFLTAAREQLLGHFSESAERKAMPPGCRVEDSDVILFVALGVILPSAHLQKQYEPELSKLCTAYRKGVSEENWDKCDQYIKKHWRPNMTLIDFDFQSKRYPERRQYVFLRFTPYVVVADLFTNIPRGVLGSHDFGVLPYLVAFFERIAMCLDKIKRQVVFEVVVDEMATFQEKLEHGLVRRDRMGTIDPKNLPTRYDRVHMSNVPDYVGGPLTTFTQTLPIFRHDKASTMTSNVLLNAQNWISHTQFLVEYLLLADRNKICEKFATSQTESSALHELAGTGTIIAGRGCMMVRHMSWVRTTSRPLKWPELMARVELERWLHLHFLKICLPYPRKHYGGDLVLALLNITMFFRLVAHLGRVGYPAHWLSEILGAMCSGRITSRARAPRSAITRQTDLNTVHPLRDISIRPFVQEFGTLLAIWRRLLPFGMILPDGALLPSLTTIREYKLRFELPNDTYSSGNMSRPVFALVLWNKSSNGPPPIFGLREALIDDEKSIKTPEHNQSLRDEDRIHVISAIKWLRDDVTVSFWFAEAVVDRLVSSGGWIANIWRTDSWERVLGSLELVDGAVVRGNTWC